MSEPAEANAEAMVFPSSPIFSVHIDDGYIVRTTSQSNLLPEGFVEVDAATFAEAGHNLGFCKLTGGVLVLLERPEPVPSVDAYRRAIQAHLDAKARERQYDSIQTAITYRGDPNPQFAAEGAALFNWRSAVWTYSTAELAKVLAGERARPSVEEFIGELPVFVWPSL